MKQEGHFYTPLPAAEGPESGGAVGAVGAAGAAGAAGAVGSRASAQLHTKPPSIEHQLAWDEWPPFGS